MFEIRKIKIYSFFERNMQNNTQKLLYDYASREKCNEFRNYRFGNSNCPNEKNIIPLQKLHKG